MAIATVAVDKFARKSRPNYWVATPDECDAVAAPLSRIAARHSVMGDGDPGDVIDGVEAAVAVAGYAIPRAFPPALEPPGQEESGG